MLRGLVFDCTEASASWAKASNLNRSERRSALGQMAPSASAPVGEGWPIFFPRDQGVVRMQTVEMFDDVCIIFAIVDR